MCAGRVALMLISCDSLSEVLFFIVTLYLNSIKLIYYIIFQLNKAITLCNIYHYKCFLYFIIYYTSTVRGWD